MVQGGIPETPRRRKPAIPDRMLCLLAQARRSQLIVHAHRAMGIFIPATARVSIVIWARWMGDSVALPSRR